MRRRRILGSFSLFFFFSFHEHPLFDLLAVSIEDAFFFSCRMYFFFFSMLSFLHSFSALDNFTKKIKNRKASTLRASFLTDDSLNEEGASLEL